MVVCSWIVAPKSEQSQNIKKKNEMRKTSRNNDCVCSVVVRTGTVATHCRSMDRVYLAHTRVEPSKNSIVANHVGRIRRTRARALSIAVSARAILHSIFVYFFQTIRYSKCEMASGTMRYVRCKMKRRDGIHIACGGRALTTIYPLCDVMQF